MNISIFASIWSQNLWDELILKNEIELLQQEFSSLCPSDISLYEGDKNSSLSSRGVPAKQEGELFFKVASYDAKNPVFQIENTQYFEYFPLGIKQVKNIFRNIRNLFTFIGVIIWSDRVVIGWGGIIYDSEVQSVWSPLKQWLFRVKVARFFRKRIYFFAVWIDIKQEENNKILEKIFKKAWKITVRDKKSQQQLEAIWIKSEIVDDPVMRENEIINRQKSAAPFSSKGERIQDWGGNILWTHQSKNFKLKDFEKYDFSWKKVGLALRSWYIGTSWDIRVERLLVEELCQYIEKKGGKIIFLPHSLHPTDIRANDFEFMKQFLNYEREIYADLWEVYTAYNHKMLDIIVSMRLHSIILSHVYGIDQIVLSYSQKTDELIKRLGS